MKNPTLLFLASFFLLFTLALTTIQAYYPGLNAYLSTIYASVFEGDAKQHQVYSEVTDTKSGSEEIAPFSGKLKKDSYKAHLTTAGLLGLELIKNDYLLYLKVSDGSLVEIGSGKGYRVDSLTYSYPFLTFDSKKVLEELGQTYEKLAGAGNFFIVSSATRTEEQQKKLKRRNRNATKGESSHSYGISFDISYIRFNGIRSWDHRAQKNLETVLHHYQQSGKIYVIKERGQSCYHVTVR